MALNDAPAVALTLWQPWASLLVATPDYKRIETRSWGTSFRGTLFIHAADRWTRADEAAADRIDLVCDAAGLPRLPRPFPRKAIVGAVDMVHCVRIYGAENFIVRNDLSALEIACGDYRAGRHAWFTERPRMFAEPVPCAGDRRLWAVPADVAARLLALVPPTRRPAPAVPNLFDDDE